METLVWYSINSVWVGRGAVMIVNMGWVYMRMFECGWLVMMAAGYGCEGCVEDRVSGPE